MGKAKGYRVVLSAVVLLVLAVWFVRGEEDMSSEETGTPKKEVVKTSSGTRSIIYFTECGYMLGYAAKNGLEEAAKNGKLFLEPSLTCELAVQGIGGKWGLSVGGELTNIRPMDWWEKTYHEKNFRLDTSEIHLGINPGLFEWDENQTRNITIGLRSISLIPPEFNDYKIPQDEILSEQEKFVEEEGNWGNKVEKSGIEIGFTRIERESGNKSFLGLAIFYVDDRLGFKISSHGAHFGMVNSISILKQENLSVYISPASILGSFDFFWWYERGWYFNYSLLGFYF